MDLESELRIYQQNNVEWVVFYNIPSSAEVNLVHQYGMSALVYQNALAAEYTDLRQRGYSDETIKSWAQYNTVGKYYYINTPTSKNASDDEYNSVRISPYGGYPSSGYLDRVLLPQVKTIISPTERNAEGIFLDVLFLKSNTDGNPGYMARYSEWLQTNQKPDTPENFQEFRYYSIYDVAKRIFEAAKTSKSSAVLVISNNNIFNREDRETYALDISRLQDVSDVLMHEHGDLDQVTPEGTIYRLKQERGDGYPLQGAQPVTKPIWIHYLTNQTERFQTMLSYMNTYNFGYWGFNQYFWTHPASRITTYHLTYGGTDYSVTILTNSIVSNFIFDNARRLINYSVTGSSETEGFCNVTVPKPLLDGEPVVFIDDSEVCPCLSPSTSINATHYLIHFTYTHSTHTVTIGGSQTIPELPTAHIGTVAFTVLAIFIALRRKRKPGTTPVESC